ncbi:MAG TPA: hypothetical protein VEG60_20505 [Candidatus Binatia bacterium]|nr:hypothetical protein [Candidatus Binatia bacterium]
MKTNSLLLFALIWVGTVPLLAAPVSGAEGVIFKVSTPDGKYCHLKFPAIREETLYWDHPVLKDPSEGDIIDFYGPCDHDPLGEEEIRAQKRSLRQRERPH